MTHTSAWWAHIVIAYIIMAYILIAYIVMAYILMAYIVMVLGPAQMSIKYNGY